MNPSTSKRLRPGVPPGPYLVVGLARSGQAAALLLVSRGQEVIGCDAGSPAGLEGLREAAVEVHLDTDGVPLLERARCLVKSPGVPREAPVVRLARERGIPVLGELELAWRVLPNRFVAVTGTNGKTTVTELLGHVWRTASEPVVVAGNVGTPLASLAGEVAEEVTVVCEASSFQLEDAEAFAPECAVLLNVTPDHLDRHHDFEDYLRAKLRIFANQGNDDVAVFNADEPALEGRDLGGCARRIPYCRGADPDCAVSINEDVLFVGSEPLMEVAELSLPGPHNADNAMAAALRSFDGGVRAILGGSLKGGGFEGLAEPVAERCVACYLIGEAADALASDLAGSGVELRRSGDLEAAVREAARDAVRSEVVLLAPACASFDAYHDYEERGEHFRSLVEELER
jgi:UDP-N-acetylmuramoylalanine--D-glutamate ligase